MACVPSNSRAHGLPAARQSPCAPRCQRPSRCLALRRRFPNLAISSSGPASTRFSRDTSPHRRGSRANPARANPRCLPICLRPNPSSRRPRCHRTHRPPSDGRRSRQPDGCLSQPSGCSRQQPANRGASEPSLRTGLSRSGFNPIASEHGRASAMSLPKRFLQVHTLTPCSAVLPDRDEGELPKRMTFGDCDRIRNSSQSPKRNLRIADDPRFLRLIDGYLMPVRSRRSVQDNVILPLTGQFPDDVIETVSVAMHNAVSGPPGKFPRRTTAIRPARSAGNRLARRKRPRSHRSRSRRCRHRRNTLPGMADKVQGQHGRHARADQPPRPARRRPVRSHDFVRSHRHHCRAHQRRPCPDRSCHRGEVDYFTAPDDLAGPGSTVVDLVGNSEPVSGPFHGYVVLDLQVLSWNRSGDAKIAGQIAQDLT